MSSDRFQPPVPLYSRQSAIGPVEPHNAAEQMAAVLPRVARRYWVYLVACACVSLVAGYFVASKFCRHTWTYEATLLYNRPASIASYTPPDADSLSKLFKARATMLQVSEAFDRQFPLDQLDRGLIVPPPYGSSVVNITLAWPDRVQGEEVLNKTIELFQAMVARHRAEALEQVAQGLRTSQVRCKEDLVRAHQAVSDFSRTHGSSDISADMSGMRKTLADLEHSLATTRSEISASEARFRALVNPGHKQLPQLLEEATLEQRKKISELEALLAERRQDFHRLADVHHQAAELEREALAVDHERQRIDDELSVVEQMCRTHLSGFTVVQPATESLMNPMSNKTKLFGACTMLCWLLLATPLFAFEVLRSREPAAVTCARRLGMPLLAYLGQSEVAAPDDEHRLHWNYDAVRLLALRIQQSLEQPGSAIMFCGLAWAATPRWLMLNLARCFSERGERILLFDLGGECSKPGSELNPPIVGSGDRLNLHGSNGYSNGASHTNGRNGHAATHAGPHAVLAEPEGLAAWLASQSTDLDELISPTAIPDVDQLQVGDCTLPREAWGTARMSDLMKQLRQRYSLILVSGLTTSRVVDMQLMAARVDGIIFTMPEGAAVEGHTDAVIRDMAQLKAPVLGLIA